MDSVEPRGGGARPAVLSVRDLRTHFSTKRGIGRAVDGVSFDLHAGETLGLVGESGSGKSLTALSILRLNPRPASRIVGGRVLLEGEDLLTLSESEMRRRRGRDISMVLQDTQTALNPVLSIGLQLYEPLRQHRSLGGGALRHAAVSLLHQLQVPDPEPRLRDHPHQFSGGMRQRIVGAIALSCGPKVLIADEPTTALDVTVQAAYLKLLKQIQAETGVAILFITHDLGAVARICDRVAVMYAGRIVESASTADIFTAPRHPYTEALMRSVPNVDVDVERLFTIEGQPPSIYHHTPGCPFAPRCPYVEARCREAYPPAVGGARGATVRCWRHVDAGSRGHDGSD